MPPSLWDLTNSANIMPSSFAWPRASTNAVTISLTSKTSDVSRTITLQPGESVTIGRASKSEIKNLQPSNENALFDCPVVSRLHAELRFTSWQPMSEQVTITDRESLHGTAVNGSRITPNHNFALRSGDEIKLGERVTRGEDTHDGLTLTYKRIESTSHDQHALAGPSFQVPSPSEPASDDDSDIESVHSYIHPPSSAHTTPDNKKMSLGTQEQPILLDTTSDASRAFVDLSNDDDDLEPLSESASAQRVIPDTYDEDEDEIQLIDESDDENDSDEDAISDDFDDAESVADVPLTDPEPDMMSQIESDVEEMDDAADTNLNDADRLSESPVSHYSANETRPGAYEDELDHRPASPELEPAFGFQPPQLTKGFSLERPQSPANGFPFNNPPYYGVKPRYDPVRNSQPPADLSATFGAAPPHAAVTEESAPPKSSYTYGSFGYGLDSNPATDMGNSSRWDVGQPSASTTHPAPLSFDYPRRPLYAPQAGHGMYPALQDSTLGQMSTMYAPPPSLWPDNQSQPIEPAVPASLKGKISIPSIIENENPTQENAPEQAEQISQETPTSSSNKRNASEMEADEPGEAIEPPAKQPRVDAAPVPPPSTGAAKYATGAVLGMAATVAFLSSPAAQWVIEALG